MISGLLVRGGHSVATADSGPMSNCCRPRCRPTAVRCGVDGRADAGHGWAHRDPADRALPPPHDATPVIALTAHASHSSRAECLGAGMNGFISKPVRLYAARRNCRSARFADRSNIAPKQTRCQPAIYQSGDLLDPEQVAELIASLGPGRHGTRWLFYSPNLPRPKSSISSMRSSGAESRACGPCTERSGLEYRGRPAG